MIFSSLTFLYIFMPALLLLYYVVKNNGYRRIILLIFSLVFYAWGEPIYVLLLLGVTGISYIFGRLAKTTDNAKKSKLFAGIGIGLILAVLVFFKYTTFILKSLCSVGFNINVPNILLPIGISFFSFQAISYIVDVKRGDAEPQRSYLKLLLYISLFPQLIAGPIVRYKDIEKQLDDRHVDIAKINDGIWRFSIGLAKKAVIANNCGVASQKLIAIDGGANLLGIWLGTLFFTFQLYYDFSGYSDMAIGLGKMFGFDFMENFRYPFATTTATEYWKNWHISLGSFFRDYVYIPLGGNRRLQMRNILIVWVLTGMWHGASWNYIIWGIYYGALIVLEKYLLIPLGERLPKIVRAVVFKIYFIFITVFGMGIFLFEDGLWKKLGYMFGVGIKEVTNIYVSSITTQNLYLLIAALLFSLPIIPKLVKLIVGNKAETDKVYIAGRIVKTLLAIGMVAVSTLFIAGSSYNPFLYYRF